MKIFILLKVFFFLNLQIFAHTGQEGNGGDVVICQYPGQPETVELVDYYEGKANTGKDIIFPEGQNYQEIALKIAQFSGMGNTRLRNGFQEFGDNIVNLINNFDKQIVFTTDELPDIPDHGELHIDEDFCKISQLAIQNANLDDHTQFYTINKTIWDRLDINQKAGLVLHEALYNQALYLKHKNSRKVRFLHYDLMLNYTHNNKVDFGFYIAKRFFDDHLKKNCIAKVGNFETKIRNVPYKGWGKTFCQTSLMTETTHIRNIGNFSSLKLAKRLKASRWAKVFQKMWRKENREVFRITPDTFSTIPSLINAKGQDYINLKSPIFIFTYYHSPKINFLKKESPFLKALYFYYNKPGFESAKTDILKILYSDENTFSTKFLHNVTMNLHHLPITSDISLAKILLSKKFQTSYIQARLSDYFRNLTGKKRIVPRRVLGLFIENINTTIKSPELIEEIFSLLEHYEEKVKIRNAQKNFIYLWNIASGKFNNINSPYREKIDEMFFTYFKDFLQSHESFYYDIISSKNPAYDNLFTDKKNIERFIDTLMTLSQPEIERGAYYFLNFISKVSKIKPHKVKRLSYLAYKYIPNKRSKDILKILSHIKISSELALDIIQDIESIHKESKELALLALKVVNNTDNASVSLKEKVRKMSYLDPREEVRTLAKEVYKNL